MGCFLKNIVYGKSSIVGVGWKQPKRRISFCESVVNTNNLSFTSRKKLRIFGEIEYIALLVKKDLDFHLGLKIFLQALIC